MNEFCTEPSTMLPELASRGIRKACTLTPSA